MLTQQPVKESNTEVDYTKGEREVIRQLREAKRRNGRRPITLVLVVRVDSDIITILEGVPRR